MHSSSQLKCKTNEGHRTFVPFIGPKRNHFPQSSSGSMPHIFRFPGSNIVFIITFCLPITHGLSDTLECNCFVYLFSVFFILCINGIIANLTVFISTKFWSSYNLSVNNYINVFMWYIFLLRSLTVAMWNCYAVIFLWNNL